MTRCIVKRLGQTVYLAFDCRLRFRSTGHARLQPCSDGVALRCGSERLPFGPHLYLQGTWSWHSQKLQIVWLLNLSSWGRRVWKPHCSLVSVVSERLLSYYINLYLAQVGDSCHCHPFTILSHYKLEVHMSACHAANWKYPIHKQFCTYVHLDISLAAWCR